MRAGTFIGKFFIAASLLSVVQCGSTLNGVKEEAGIPVSDQKALSDATMDANRHPHDASILIEFGDELYGAEQYYKAYYQWDYALKLEADNKDAKERIDGGIKVLYYKAFPDIKTEAEFMSKWNDQSWKRTLKYELDSAVIEKTIARTHLPKEVVKKRLTELRYNMEFLQVSELGLEYEGYVAYVIKKMPYFSQKELFRELKIEQNMSEGKFYEAATAVNMIPKYFPHAKFEAEKLEVTIKDKWNTSLRSQKSMDFAYFNENKEALFSFIEFYQGSKEADKLKNYIEEMLYNYFNSTSINDITSATEYWNNSQRFTQVFRNSTFAAKVKQSVADKWSKYLLSSASVIISSPQRVRNELFAFRNAFAGDDQGLVKNVEKELDTYMFRRYSGLSVADTADIAKMYDVLSNYDKTFPSSEGYFSLKKDYAVKISNYILAYKVYNGESLGDAKAIFEGLKGKIPSAEQIPAVKEYLEAKDAELHEECVKFYEMAKESKSKNQYTLAARYVTKALEFEPHNLDAKSLSASMSDYMDAISSFTSVITSANDAETYDEAIGILNDYLKKYSSYTELTADVQAEKKRLKRYAKRWDKREKNAFK